MRNETITNAPGKKILPFDLFLQEEGYPMLRRMACTIGVYPSDLDDDIQDALVKLFRGRKTHTAYSNPLEFRRYVSLTLMSVRNDHWRHNARRDGNYDPVLDGETESEVEKEVPEGIDLSTGSSPFEIASFHELLRGIADDLSTFEDAEGNRMIFELYFLRGETNKRISEKMGIPIGTVKSRINRIRALLQKSLIEKGYNSKE